MHNHIHADAAQGFDLPAALKVQPRQHDHLIAIAALVASVCAATIIGAQIIFG
ncbi:hypothetical protein [Brucella anthropi]|uniref:hypothetical protein n=1 Tax=Brucella anthropi TaxID=529 RepID=UPI00178C27F9|nr:hypothetical protein [Brucella anthropi]